MTTVRELGVAMRRPTGGSWLTGGAITLLLAIASLAAHASPPVQPFTEVIGVTIEPGATRSVLTIRCSRELLVRSARWSKTGVLSLNLPNTRTSMVPEDLTVGSGGIRSLQSRALADGSLQVELHLQQGWQAGVNSGARTRTVTFIVTRIEVPGQTASSLRPTPKRTLQPVADDTSRAKAALKDLPPPPKIARLLVSATGKGADWTYTIPADKELKARWASLPGDNPRFYIDLLPVGNLEIILPTLDAGAPLRSIRQGRPETGATTVRIVLDLKPGMTVTATRSPEDGKIRLRVHEGVLKALTPSKADRNKAVRRKFLIAVDAGHGGRDPGATGTNKLHEKTVTLDVARRLRTLLLGWGYRVAISRTGDVSLPASARAEWVREIKPQVLVSLHCDAISRPSWYGASTYFHTGDATDRRLAETIQQHLVRTVKTRDLGVRSDATRYRRGFYILRVPGVAAALVEMGYLTHEATARKLATASYRQLLAQGIADGIDSHLLP